MIKLSAKSYTQIYQTVKAYYDADGEDGDSIADDCICDLKNNQLTFELWDALGTDELGHVASNPQLKKLYTSISKSWTQASANLQ